MKNGLKIKYVSLDNLKAWEKNPRKNDKAAEKLASLIASYGFINPIVASPDGTIRAGHTRIKAAQKLGMKEVPVLYVDFGSEEKAIGYSIADNKSVEWANWDEELLSDVMVDLKGLDFDLDMTGFTEIEVDKLIPDDNGEDFDAQAEAQKIVKPKTKPGEIIQLGRHRVLCGDSTKREDVEKLMDGKKADMVFTDPPYNVQLNYEGYEDNKAIGDYLKLIESAFNLINEFTQKSGSIYCMSGDKYLLEVSTHFKQIFRFSQLLLWIKDNPTLGNSDYQYNYEAILYGWNNRKSKHNFYGGSVERAAIIFERDTGKEKTIHPAQRPIDLVSYYLKNSSKQNNLILDLFLGSGSTLIACEKTNRICYGMEIDPIYCDVIRNRYEKYIANN